jgi:hypothetical protein
VNIGPCDQARKCPEGKAERNNEEQSVEQKMLTIKKNKKTDQESY